MVNMELNAGLSLTPQSKVSNVSDTSESRSVVSLTKGWEFTLWFFKQIAHFLWAKERNSDSLLGIKRGKMMKNKRKIRILANPLFYKCFTWITSDLLTLLFCKEQRQRHLWSLFKMSNLSKRAKREWAKEQITNPALTGFSQSQQSLTAWCHWIG